MFSVICVTAGKYVLELFNGFLEIYAIFHHVNNPYLGKISYLEQMYYREFIIKSASLFLTIWARYSAESYTPPKKDFFIIHFF